MTRKEKTTLLWLVEEWRREAELWDLNMASKATSNAHRRKSLELERVLEDLGVDITELDGCTGRERG